MNIQSNEPQASPEAEAIVDEAIDWLICLDDDEPAPEDPYHDRAVRNRAFFQWVLRSVFHLRTFMELVELGHRLECVHPGAFDKIRASIADLQQNAPR
jgi:ferric-dicitrate binding protein FerR (iron transport regulator)